jgi:hypothetical protein
MYQWCDGFQIIGGKGGPGVVQYGTIIVFHVVCKSGFSYLKVVFFALGYLN